MRHSQAQIAQRRSPKTQPRAPIQLVPIRTNDIWHRFLLSLSSSPSLLVLRVVPILPAKNCIASDLTAAAEEVASFFGVPFCFVVVVATVHSVLHVTLLLAFLLSLTLLLLLCLGSCSKCHTNVEHVMFCHYVCKWNAAAVAADATACLLLGAPLSHVDHMPSSSADEVGIFPIIRIALLCVFVLI